MPILLYQCKYCGSIHNTKEDAIKCEGFEKIEPKWPIGQTFRSPYYNIAIEILARNLVLHKIIHSWKYQVRLNNGYVTDIHESEILNEIMKGDLKENHPKPNSLNNVYYCSICGREHETEQLAQSCEAKGNPSFKYDVGWKMEEYDGDFVAHLVARRINFDRGEHVIEYGMQYKDGFVGPDELPPGFVSKWVSEERLDIATKKKYY